MPSATLLVLCGTAERREGFVRMLSQAGWNEIVSTSCLSEAVRILRGTTRGCAIVDVQLDDAPGLKAVSILHSLCDQIRIVFTAPQNSRDLEAQVRAADVFYYHVGPADSQELVAAVKDAIGAPTRAAPVRPGKVLIVDDDPAFHAVVRTLLEPRGYRVVSAYSLREGLEKAREQTPQLILLDIIMETSTDGFAFCQEARRDPLIRHTPILGVSAIEGAIGAHALDGEPGLFPVDGYLSKPITPDELFSELKRLVPREA